MMQQQIRQEESAPKLGMGAKFEDFQRRAKEALVPANLWKSPWVKVGLGFAVGYALASRRKGSPGGHETVFHAIVRASLAAAAAMLVRQAFEEPPAA